MDATLRRPMSDDTTLEAERIWLDVLRAKGPAWRMAQAMALSAAVHRMALAAYDRVHPGATPLERLEWQLRQAHGDAVADLWLAQRRAREVRGGP